MRRTEAIANFLSQNSQHPFKYHPHLEVQVNVEPGQGTRDRASWTDGLDRWSAFRIPRKDAGEGGGQDTDIGFDLSQHAFAIGVTGWNYHDKVSEFCGYDLDSVRGHKKGLEDDELTKIVNKLKEISYVTILRSTGGSGYHCYISIANSLHVGNHTEHAALARAILSKLSALCNYAFEPKFDACGSILWIWHKKQVSNAYESIHLASGSLSSVPPDWKSFTTSNSIRKNHRLDSSVSFDAVALEPEHQRLIKWLEDNHCSWSWNSELNLLVCHTYNLKQAHKELNYVGNFDTVATGASGANEGQDHNCYCTPLRGGSWVIRRFGKESKEHSLWKHTDSKSPSIYYNCFNEFGAAARKVGGALGQDGSYYIPESTRTIDAVAKMGGTLRVPEIFKTRSSTLKDIGNDKILVSFPMEKSDAPPEGWYGKGKTWLRIVELPKGSSDVRVRVPHDKIRHVVNAGVDGGWFRAGDNGTWVREPRVNIQDLLTSMGHNRTNTNLLLGKAVEQYWTIEATPFQKEYPGGRTWNRHSAKFAVTPTSGVGSSTKSSGANTATATWDSIFSHCGQSLNYHISQDPWCRLNGVHTGRDYLILWTAWMLQRPEDRLPYLFFYGHQNTGKSTFHLALKLFFKGGIGCVEASTALMSSGNFNQELEGTVLCTIEEVDLTKRESIAYNRIKNWSTSPTILVHQKRFTPYSKVNTTHWVQVGNSIKECPILPGDTRITAIYVPALHQMRNPVSLFESLQSEMPAMLWELLQYPLPPRSGRLNIPIITTSEKEDQAEGRLNDVELFIQEHCYKTFGQKTLFADFYQAISPMTEMTKIAVSKALRSIYDMPLGKCDGTGALWIGNLSLTKDAEEGARYVRIKERLRQE